MIKFINSNDINLRIDTDDYYALMSGTYSVTLESAVFNYAKGIVSSYLGDKYDVARAMSDYNDYSNSTTYSAYDRIAYNPGSGTASFTALKTVTGATPSGNSNDTNWTSNTIESVTLKYCIIDIALFQLFARTNPKNSDHIRKYHYEESMQLLKDFWSGKIILDIPLKYIAADGEENPSMLPHTTFKGLTSSTNFRDLNTNFFY